MGLFNGLFGKKQPAPVQQPNKLSDDIRASTQWIIMAMLSSGYKADLTVESMREIDRFFDEQNTPDGILSKNRGTILFSLGCYIGETIINNFGGCWITDDNDPQGEMNIAVKLPDGTTLFPVQRCMKRYQNGMEDSIYAYVYALQAKIQ